MTTPSNIAPVSEDPASRTWYRGVALAIGGAAIVLLLVGLAGYYDSLAGGQVMSETAFRERMAQTEEAGEEAVWTVGSEPDAVIDQKDMADPSCVDDFGFDSNGVTRDQPTVTWAPDFADRGAYTAAVDVLRKSWSAEGLSVESIPAPAKGEPGGGLPGIRVTNEDGIELSLRPDWYSGEAVLTADGGCVRHEGYSVDWE